MTKSYSTKRSLLTSVISLILCFAMLLGTTFAWFTDNVTSTNNKIVAGNLDVKLEYQNDEVTSWTEVTDKTNVFKENTLWEPGHVEVVKLKVTNEGTLAFKYMLDVNVVSEVTSINVDGDELQLSKYIKYGIVDGDQDFTRSEAVAAVEATATPLETAFTEEKTLLPKDNKDNEDNFKYVTMVVYMPETITNEANYAKGEDVPEINLGINIYATQFTYEEDSFDEKYDEAATYEKGKPIAKTRELTTATTLTVKDDGGNDVVILGKDLEINLDSANGFGMDLGDNVVNLDTAYQFEPTLTLDEAVASEYEQWHADFVVSVDQDIPANSVALAGYYNAWCSLINDNKWVALTNKGFDVKANQEIRLIESMHDSITVSLKDLSQYGNDGIGFLCGAMMLDEAIIGTTLTVELRLYEATDGTRASENIENYITIRKFNYTFE